MAEQGGLFSDGAAYERFMGPWTVKIGAAFLDWLQPARGLRWLEAGCGTGIFTELLLDRCAPGEVIALDPAPAQVAQAKKKPVATRADFRVADAQKLPFDDGAFDVAASALVINFIADRPRAMAEMKRVVKRGGWVAGYVWDFTGPLGVSRYVAPAVRDLGGPVLGVPGADSTKLEAFRALFESAGLHSVEARVVEAAHTYDSAADYWTRYIENPTPQTAFIKGLPEAEQRKLRTGVEASLPVAADGTVTFPARAHAAKGRV